jgi:hypothetical protein
LQIHTQGAPDWIFSPLDHTRWSTLLTFAVVAVVVGLRTRRPLIAVVAALAWLSGFEILYQATGLIRHGWSPLTLTYTTAGTAGWTIALWWAGFRPNWKLVAVFAASWVAWVALGFDSNMPDRIIPGADLTFSWTDEAMNVGTKTLLAVAVAFGTLAATGRLTTSRTETPP